jgi:hypothetical protein
MGFQQERVICQESLHSLLDSVLFVHRDVIPKPALAVFRLPPVHYHCHRAGEGDGSH